MIKIIFPFQVKYKGHYIQANTTFEAEESDKKELLKMGGKVSMNKEHITKNNGGKNEPASKIKNSNSE